MKFLKRNKSIFIIIGIILVILLVTFIAAWNLLFSEYNTSAYGNRLDGIENVPISEETINSSKEVFSSLKGIENVSYNLSGKICKYIIIVTKDAEIDKIKSSASKLLEKFTDEQKNFYDFQILIDIKEDSDIYPIAGYKIKDNKNFTWTGKEVKNEE